MNKAIYFLNPPAFHMIYGPLEQADLSKKTSIHPTPISEEEYLLSSRDWQEVEYIFSGWGMAKIDDAFLKKFPKLKAVFYGAGSIKYFATDAMWERGIRITSAFATNAIPVCEYTVAQIFFSLKHGWRSMLDIRAHKKFPQTSSTPPGAYRSTVGLLSLGMIGKMVAERLKNSDLHIIAYDPFIKPEKARELNVELASLDEVFSRADVVSCHTPWLKETEQMIRGCHFEMMKKGATFLNTARGAVVHEQEMIEVMRRRPDLMAVLDVTYPEPPPENSPLYSIDNIVLTPHIAGSLGNECQRMGRCMIEEFDRYISGQPMKYEITRAMSLTMA